MAEAVAHTAEELLSVSEVALFEGLTERAVRMRIAHGLYSARPRDRRAQNGRRCLGIPVHQLTPPAQARYQQAGLNAPSGGALRLAERSLSSTSTGGGAETSLQFPPDLRASSVPVLPDGSPDLALMLSMGQTARVEEYDRRISAVSRIRARLDATDRGNQTTAWERIAAEVGVNSVTLRRWDALLRAEGPTGLVPGDRSHRGERKAIPDALQRSIKAAYLTQQRATLTQIMRHVVYPWCRAHGAPAPHRGTVGRFIEAEIFRSARVAGREGRRAWEAKIAAKVTRDPLALSPNELWCADNRKLDLVVFSPDGRPVRPWVTSIVDLRSAAWVAWRFSEQPSSRTVALALRDAILRWGVPEWLYMDNGKDFQASSLRGAADGPPGQDPPSCPTALPWEVLRAGMLQTLEIQVHTALPFHAWSKPIESFFHAFASQHENLIPGWCGRDAQEKPEVLKAHVAQGKLLAWDQARVLFARLVDDWNANHVCGPRRDPPVVHYQGFTKRHVAQELLDLFLLKIERDRTVQPNGLQVAGRRFLNPDLALHVGERCRILYDPDDPRAIVVLLPHSAQRLIVPELPPADWHTFDDSQRIAQECRRAQRAQIRDLQSELAPYRNPEYLDPTGAARMIEERRKMDVGRLAVTTTSGPAPMPAGPLSGDAVPSNVPQPPPAVEAARELQQAISTQTARATEDARGQIAQRAAPGRAWWTRQERYREMSTGQVAAG